MDRRLGEPQNWSGHGGKKKNTCPCQKLNSSHPGHSQSQHLLILKNGEIILLNYDSVTKAGQFDEKG
jgi:hypothetical protein